MTRAAATPQPPRREQGCREHSEKHGERARLPDIFDPPEMAGGIRDGAGGADEKRDKLCQPRADIEQDRHHPRRAIMGRGRHERPAGSAPVKGKERVEQPGREQPAGIVGERHAEIHAAIAPDPGF